MVLHQHRRLDARQMRAGRDADPLFFFREANEDHLRIVFSHPHQVHEPRFRQRRDEPHPARFERVIDQPGIRRRHRHGEEPDTKPADYTGSGLDWFILLDR